VEVDLDGSYVLTEEEIEESNKVKLFEHFIEDLKGLLKNRQIKNLNLRQQHCGISQHRIMEMCPTAIINILE